MSAAVEAALSDGHRRPPEGVSPSDWDRVREAHAADPALPVAALRRLGPALGPGQMVLVLDEVLTRGPGHGQAHEVRTACLLTAEGRRYLSGTGSGFLRQVRAAVQACCDHSLLVVADGARWIRTFFQHHLGLREGGQMVLDWYHLAKKCRERAVQTWSEREQRHAVLRRLLRALWAGDVRRALRVLATSRRRSSDPQAVDTLCAYLVAPARWIPDYRARRRQRRYIGNGLGEKANDRIVVRRQKRRGRQWGTRSSDGLAALRTLLLNEGWETYWHDRRLIHLTAA